MEVGQIGLLGALAPSLAMVASRQAPGPVKTPGMPLEGSPAQAQIP